MDQETFEQRSAFALMKAASQAEKLHGLSPRHPNLSRKRFKKLMMSEGTPRDIAEQMCEGIGLANGAMGYFDFYIWFLANRNRYFLNSILDNTIKIGDKT